MHGLRFRGMPVRSWRKRKHPRIIRAMISCDVLILGASASGLLCAAEAAKRGRRVIVIDHAKQAGMKILMSGGGRCNFTNLEVSAEHYLSDNPHFCKSALSRFTQWDFIARVSARGIEWEERRHGQLFCRDSAEQILDLLLEDCEQQGVEIRLNTAIAEASDIRHGPQGFDIASSRGCFRSHSLVVASGGLSFPRVCASPIGYRIAEAFGHAIVPTRPGLVPLTLQPEDKQRLAPLSGIAVDSRVENERAGFRENLLFTHRGLSGPAILQISSWWRPGEAIDIDLLPELDLLPWLLEQRERQPATRLRNLLHGLLPKRLLETRIDERDLNRPLQEQGRTSLQHIAQQLQHWSLRPGGNEGYRTAEVTVGGVDTRELSSRTLESRRQPGLYFIGEVVDVTGWLGGYNFQWAWSSGWAAGQAC